MKITKPFVVIVTLICMSIMHAAMAQGVRPGPSLSPRPNLTGATYCLFGQGTWLFADPGNSIAVTANPFAVRLNFTSSTELAITEIYYAATDISFPPAAISDRENLDEPGMGTYTLVGNLLTITQGGDESTSFIMTPDAQVFVGGFAERGEDGNVQSWETGMLIGVRAANCDLPVLSNQTD